MQRHESVGRVRETGSMRTAVMRVVLLSLAIATACAEPNTAVRDVLPAVSVSITAAPEPSPPAATGVTRLTFTMRNAGASAVTLSGCPNAPAFALEEELNQWFEVASVGVVCLAIHVPEHVTLAPQATVTRTFGVGKPGRYRIRMYFDDPQDGALRWVTSPAVDVK